MNWFEKFVEKACEQIALLAPDHKIITRGDNEPYLERYFFFRREWVRKFFRAQQWNVPRWVEGVPSIYLHHFVKGDDEEELHSHPWKRSVSLILTVGYREERRVGNGTTFRIVKPWHFNVIGEDDFHKVELLDKERGVWTIFVAGLDGEEKHSWGFWHPGTGLYLDWRDHISLREQKKA